MIGTYTNTIDNIKGAYRIAQKEYAEHPDIKARMATVNGEGTNTLINQSLQLPALSQGIIETPFEGFPMRTLLNYISSPNNPTVVIPREMGSSRAVVMRVAEGAEIPLNFAPLTSITCQCYKIAEGFIVSKELQQFQQIGVIEQKARHLAFKMKHTENVDVITAIGAGVPAPNILATTGVSLGQDGTVFVFPGTIGQFDITAGIRILQENFKGTTGKMVLMVNPAGLQGLNRLPMYP